MTTTDVDPTAPARVAHRSTRHGLSLFWFALAAIVVLALLALSLFTGEYSLTGHEDGWDMFGITRVPRTISLVLAGAAMAASGLVMQLLTQNRFVEPTTTGTTEWASLGLLVVLHFVPGVTILGKMIGAIVFAFIGTLVFFLFLRRVSLRSSLIVPIVGIMLGAVVSAMATFFAVATGKLETLAVWFAGSFTAAIRGQYEVLWIVLLVLVGVVIAADRITVAGLGEDVATNIGVNYNRMVLVGTLLVAIAAGVVTVAVGNLPFLGLIIPNVVSLMRGDDLRSNLPWVCLLGVGTVTVCDLIGRTIISPFEIPVSVILGVIGATVFVVLIAKNQGATRG